MPEKDVIDQKFEFLAVNRSNGKVFTNADGMIFLAKDDLFPETLSYYHKLVCLNKGSDSPEAKSIKLMMARVDAWRAAHQKRCKLPDITGEEEEAVLLRPNGPPAQHPV